MSIYSVISLTRLAVTEGYFLFYVGVESQCFIRSGKSMLSMPSELA